MRLQVSEASKGQRLDQFIAAELKELSRSRAAALIEQGAITLAGKPVKPSMRLRGGELIDVTIPEAVPTEVRAEALPLEVLFEDKDLVVIDKAPGMVVHPAAGNWEGTLVNALLHHVKDLQGVGGELRPGIVHRLDKDTSGCLVVAKNEAALSGLQRSFKGREVLKTYLALVKGAPKHDHAIIETLYGRHPKDRKRFTGKVKEGKTAVTEYRVKERFKDAALLEVTLHTGRTHQIRVHLSEAGLPLLADETYGRKRSGRIGEIEAKLGRQALHAWKLAFPHPRTKKPMQFEAPIPQDLKDALQALRT